MAEAPNRSNSKEDRRLEWVETVNQMEQARLEEDNMRNKMVRKIKENPFVPIGMTATAIILSYGIYSMRTGNKQRSQMMMRARIAAQGCTLAALLLGIVVSASKKKSVG